MKKVISLTFTLFVAFTTYAQHGKIDLSKDPTLQQPPLNNKSDATLLKETQNAEKETDTLNNRQLAEQYSNLNTPNNGTFKAIAPNPAASPDQPQLMNAQQQQGQIGNLKTNSATYYDNSGKVRSSSTTIQLGGKK